MNIAVQHTSAIQRLGYTQQEAEFLYLVATFSGYFLPRQFVAFAGIKWGKRSTNFAAKLERRGHATWREYLSVGGVYQLYSKTLYRVIDRENLRNHRRHSLEFIRTRILLLDFVLSNPAYDYLENEEDKVHYFHRELALPITVLPSKQYAPRPDGRSMVRYFVDRFPVFFETSEDRVSRRPTLSYVDAGDASLAGFRHYLGVYEPMLRMLPWVSVLYISNSTVHFVAAEKRFRVCLAQLFPACDATNLLRYFRLRSAWERKQYGSLSTEDIEWLEKARTQFQTRETESLFDSWAAGSTSDEDVTRLAGAVRNTAEACFRPHLVTATLAPSAEAAERGEA
jgi:hypothetical protein